MDEFLARLRDEKTQLTLVSLTAAIVIVMAVVAMLPSDGSKTAGPASSPTGSGAEFPTATDGGGTARPGGSGSRPGSATVSGPASGPLQGAAPNVPPVTATQVKVGITYAEDPGGANAAAGFSVAQVDQRRGWEALVKDINKNPPFGRKIVPVWYSQTEDDVTSKGMVRIAQEACARFTQDNKVFMVWAGVIANNDTLSACLTKAKVPHITFSLGESHGETFRSFPYLVEPGGAAMDRMAGFYVDQLVAAKFFSTFKSNSPPYLPTKPADGKPRIGLIRYDQPSHKAGSAALKKRLAAHGLSLCGGCEFEISYSTDNVAMQLDDATEINAAIQNCKSRPDGACTHMLFLGSAAQRIPVFFIDGAERQQYRPRIGFSPLDEWKFVRDFLGPAGSDAQYRQSQIVTWRASDFGDTSGGFGRCKKIFSDGGETFEGDEKADKEAMINQYCDVAFYYSAAMAATDKVLNLDSWVRGVHTMKPVSSAGVYRVQTKPGRHDGVGAVRVGSWDDGCTCFKPSGAITPV